jgi:hypothetical protein
VLDDKSNKEKDMSIEAMKLALEAHKKNERHQTVAETRYWCQQYKLLAEQFIQAIEQAEQAQPVAWQWLNTAHFRKKLPKDAEQGAWTPLYTAPPQRQPLPSEPTKEMIDAAERIDWADSDVRGNIVNMWQTMVAAAPHRQPLTDEQCEYCKRGLKTMCLCGIKGEA